DSSLGWNRWRKITASVSQALQPGPPGCSLHSPRCRVTNLSAPACAAHAERGRARGRGGHVSRGLGDRLHALVTSTLDPLGRGGRALAWLASIVCRESSRG